MTYPQFRHAGVVLARATTDPGDLELPGEECLADGDIDPQAGLAWLDRAWHRADISDTVAFASPALAAQIEHLLATGERGTDRRQIRRTVLAAATYLLRWRSRATPFGLFAGVTSASIRSVPAADFTGHQSMARPDARWLAAVTDRLERHADLLPRLTVILNSAGFTRAGRFVVPVQSASRDPGIAPLAENSIRLTGPIRHIITATTTPVTAAALIESLTTRFPAASTDKIRLMLAQLIAQGALLTGLRSPATTIDPLGHLLTNLRDAGASNLSDLSAVVADLTAIHHQAAQHNTAATACQAAAIRADVSERMRAIYDPPGPVLSLDVALDADIALPEEVLREAEAAATVMLRLSAHPFGPTYWKDFQFRFRSRYGPGALVPVRDVIADSGLGLPAGYLDAPRGRSNFTVSGRDQVLLNLIQEASIDGRTEIELSEPMIQALTVGDPADAVPPSRVELGFEVHADSIQELARGRFQLWITGAPRPESSMAGRFAHLLSESDRNRLAATYAPGDGDAIAAQLSFSPRGRVDSNIVRTPLMLPHAISVAEPADGLSQRIGIDDLAVTADATQMYLIQISTGRRVVPRVMNALEATLRMPPLARFLSEVALARHAVYGAFDFGAAHDLPHLPRIRYRRSVLAPARWVLSATDLAGADAPMPDWNKAFDAWRDRWHVPSSILFCQGELRLPLDLTDPFHRRLARTRLERTGKVEIRESPGDASAGWAGRPCGFLVPLRADDRRRSHRAPSQAALAALAAPGQPHPPGDGHLLHARIVGNPARFPDIITGPLPSLAQQIGAARWWYRRIRDTTRPDTDEYLHLYMRLPEVGAGAYGDACQHLALWAGDLHAAGLVAELGVLTYRAQPGRWGIGDAADAAEGIFTTDTTAAIAELEMAARTAIPLQAIAAASMADLAANLADTPLAGLRSALDHLTHQTGKLDRVLRAHSLALAETSTATRSGPHPPHPGTDRVAAAWHQRSTAVATWREARGGQHGALAVLPSLLHDHHRRVIGVDPDGERVTNRLVRTIAQRRLAAEPQRQLAAKAHGR